MPAIEEAISRDTRVRKLPPNITNTLCGMLDQQEEWMALAANIPNSLGRPGQLYNMDQLRLFDNAGRVQGGSWTREVLKDWGTRNPNVSHLIDVLSNPAVNLRRAAQYLERLIDPTNISAAESEVLYSRQDFEIQYDSPGPGSVCQAPPPPLEPSVTEPPSHRMSTDSDEVVSQQDSAQQDEVRLFPFKQLEDVTCRFSGGCFIGHGGFSSVYYGVVNREQLAIKVLNNVSTQTRQFHTECSVLTKFKHKNLLPIVGFSTDGPSFCIVYPYIENGSLEDRLACKGETCPLPWRLRVDIMKGSAEGIHFLHTSQAKPMVHRDIKSANILLDKDFIPKLGDFGLAREGPANKTAVKTSTVIGTSAYMAPESIYHKISDKLDSFSFGVVILEVLTGLAPMDQEREEASLKSHIEENYDWDIKDVLDTRAGAWDDVIAQKLVNIAKRCTIMEKKRRSAIKDILPEILSL